MYTKPFTRLYKLVTAISIQFSDKAFAGCMLTVFLFIAGAGFSYGQSTPPKEGFTVVSTPDFFNFDVPEPWPRWDPAVNWYLQQISNEQPEFVLVAGDMVNGHWWDGPKCIEQMAALYYGSWKRRMDQHGLKYYVAIGDHELGDDPWPVEKVALVPHFESSFQYMFEMPENGPENKKELAYYVRHENALFITVETFEVIENEVVPTIGPEQLEWFKKVLKDNADATFKVVQGHVPIFGNPNSRSSSMIMLKDGTENPFYKAMQDAGVDVYLCGEFHDVTIDKREKLWQVVHGSSWGREIVNTQDYLVMYIGKETMKLTMKSFPMLAEGENMWNLHKVNGPLEIVRIPAETMEKGPDVTGTLTVHKKDGETIFKDITGIFQMN